MAIIEGALGQSVFEQVRDRIAAILSDELGNQAVLHADLPTPDTDLVAQLQKMKIVTERFRPFNKNDYPAIDVFMFDDSFDNKGQGCVRGTVQYFLDIYTDGERKNVDPNTDAGDQLSSKRGQRIAGLVRAILEHSGYVTLLFEPGQQEYYIQRTIVSSIRRTQEENNRDGLNVMFYRVIFTVVTGETSGELDTVPLALHTTNVKIDETDLGYQYIFNPNA